MKIIILGAGQVGGTLAGHLASEKNDIVLIDKDSNLLRELQDRLDIATIAGHGSHPGVLERAGAKDADILLAVTDSDEINMAACQVAHSLFRTPTKISRIRAFAYTSHKEIFAPDAIPIDVIISPEQLITKYIHRLIVRPGALQVLSFADGKAELVALKTYRGGPLIGKKVRQLNDLTVGKDIRVAAIFRSNSPIIPEADTTIEANDEVFFIASAKDILPVMSELGRLDRSYRRIMIAGGGNIGLRLAETIENDYHVKIIERQVERAKLLSQRLDKTIVLQGSASDKNLLQTENIEDTDLFCALTNDDEANIMAAMLAKRMGARRVITLINNPAYVDLVQGGEIDIAISPQLITVSSLLRHVRRGDMSNVYSLRRGAAEAIEAVAHGDSHSSKVVGKTLGQLKLPEGVTVGAVVRGDEVLMAHKHVEIKTDDHVILFVVDKRRIRDVEKMFQVGFSFF
jgi:trk system potassium uptake protein TrkA